MSLDNEEIKIMFEKLQKFVEKNTEEGKREHKEIREWLRKLCDRMTSNENTIDNHLLNTEKNIKSRREKISYLIAGVGIIIAAISLYVKF